MKKNNTACESGSNNRRGRSLLLAVLLVFVVLLSAGSGLYAGASFFAQQAPDFTITTTIFTTTTSWTTSTVWSTVTSLVQGVLTTVEYTTSMTTVTMTAGAATATSNFGYMNSGTGNEDGNYLICSAFSMPVAGTVISMSFYTKSVTGSGPWKVKLGIYDDSSGSPKNLKLGPTEWSTTSLTTGWHTVAMTATLLAPGTYWLCDDNNGGGIVSYASGSLKYKALSESANWPNPTGSGFITVRYTDAVYATYIPATTDAQPTEAVFYSNVAQVPLLNFYAQSMSDSRSCVHSDSSYSFSEL